MAKLRYLVEFWLKMKSRFRILFSIKFFEFMTSYSTPIQKSNNRINFVSKIKLNSTTVYIREQVKIILFCTQIQFYIYSILFFISLIVS